MVIKGGYLGYTPSQKVNKMGASEGVQNSNTSNIVKEVCAPLYVRRDTMYNTCRR